MIFCAVSKKAVANCSPSRKVLSIILKLERLPEEHSEEASVTPPLSYSSLSRNVPSVMIDLERLSEEHVEEASVTVPSSYPK